jgi:trans-aconitate 3-methyltransferase
MTWDDLLSYFQTWSSLHTYRERYPEDSSNPEGDISVRFWKKLKGDKKKEDEIVVEWPVAMILVKKV